MLGLVQDEPALRAGAASGILDKTCARRSAGGQVGSKEWSSRSHQGMAVWILGPDRHVRSRGSSAS